MPKTLWLILNARKINTFSLKRASKKLSEKLLWTLLLRRRK